MTRFFFLLSLTIGCRHPAALTASGTVTILDVSPGAIDAGASATVTWTTSLAGESVVAIAPDLALQRGPVAANKTLSTIVPGSSLVAGQNSGEIVVVPAGGEAIRASFIIMLNAAATTGGTTGGATGGTTGGPVDPCASASPTETDYAAIAGDGSLAAPWLICTPDQLSTLSYVNTVWSKSFALGKDIDVSQATASPFIGIGTMSNPFTGTFDGQGHKVSNVVLHPASGDGTGFFGSVVSSYTFIRNLTLDNVTITGPGANNGGLIGYADRPTIVNCSVTSGTVQGGDVQTGGLVGYADHGTIVSTCSANATVSSPKQLVGGLIGDSGEGTLIFNSYSTGSVTGESQVGGLIGRLWYGAGLFNSYSTADVTSATGLAAGLIGEMGEITIVNSFCTGKVTSASADSGSSGWCVSHSADPFPSLHYYSGAICQVAGGACTPEGNNEVADSDLTHFYSSTFAPINAWDTLTTWAPPAGTFPTLAPQLFDYGNWGDCSTHQSDTPFAGSGMRGTPEAPYLICTAGQLQNLTNSNLWTGVAVRLMNDTPIDLTGHPMTPIGNNSVRAWIDFDGNGKTISNYTLNDQSSKPAVAFMGNFSGVVKRLAMVNANISTDAGYAGIISAGLWSTVTDCYTTGSITNTGAGAAGGICGDVTDGTTMDSYSTATVTAGSGPACGIGGWDTTFDVFSAASVSGGANSGQIMNYQNSCSGGTGLADSYYDQTKLCPTCCTPVNGTPVPGNWFYDPSNPPMNTWDFNNIWQASPGTYPVLR